MIVKWEMLSRYCLFWRAHIDTTPIWSPVTWTSVLLYSVRNAFWICRGEFLSVLTRNMCVLPKGSYQACIVSALCSGWASILRHWRVMKHALHTNDWLQNLKLGPWAIVFVVKAGVSSRGRCARGSAKALCATQATIGRAHLTGCCHVVGHVTRHVHVHTAVGGNAARGWHLVAGGHDRKLHGGQVVHGSSSIAVIGGGSAIVLRAIRARHGRRLMGVAHGARIGRRGALHTGSRAGSVHQVWHWGHCWRPDSRGCATRGGGADCSRRLVTPGAGAGGGRWGRAALTRTWRLALFYSDITGPRGAGTASRRRWRGVLVSGGTGAILARLLGRLLLLATLGTPVLEPHLAGKQEL